MLYNLYTKVSEYHILLMSLILIMPILGTLSMKYMSLADICPPFKAFFLRMMAFIFISLIGVFISPFLAKYLPLQDWLVPYNFNTGVILTLSVVGSFWFMQFLEVIGHWKIIIFKSLAFNFALIVGIIISAKISEVLEEIPFFVNLLGWCGKNINTLAQSINGLFFAFKNYFDLLKFLCNL